MISTSTSAESSSSLTASLLAACQRPVDARTRARAILHWLDWIACVAAGARSEVGKLLRRSEQPSPSYDSLLGPATDEWQAILLDAACANVEEMDDMHRRAILHPGPVIIPALAGLARRGEINTKQILDALVRGYEIMIRIGRAVGTKHYFYWHNTATAGAFGAAGACADALALTSQQAIWALGNAGTLAAGLWQMRLEPVMSKQLHTAHAAWVGRSAARLALLGFTGPEHILEGERGFFAAMCANGNPELIMSQDDDWLIHETSFKPWPACRHTHGTIDCVLALREAISDPFSFVSAEVECFQDALTICNNPHPRTRTEAKFSLQYCVAATAKFGTLKPDHFDEAQFLRPDLRAATARVQLKPSADLDIAYPNHYGARVTLKFSDGSTHTFSVTDSLGDPERPMDKTAIFTKAEVLLNYGGITPRRRDEILETVASLYEAPTRVLASPFPASLLQPLF